MRPVGRRFEPRRAGRPLNVVPKCIIVTEGNRTEQIYFDALRENRAVAGISGLVDIVLLQREPADSGLSHPLVLLDLLEKYMGCVKSGRYSVDLILEVVCNEVLKAPAQWDPIPGWSASASLQGMRWDASPIGTASSTICPRRFALAGTSPTRCSG